MTSTTTSSLYPRFPAACIRLTADLPAALSDLRHETGRPQPNPSGDST